MITWYHVTIPGKQSFGFSSIDGRIDNYFPDYKLRGLVLSMNRSWFTDQKAQVMKLVELPNVLKFKPDI